MKRKPIKQIYGYIYMTINLVDGMKYIGQHYWTKPCLDSNYFGSGNLMLRALKKYGRENFVVELLDWAEDKEQLNELEIHYIGLYDAVNSKEFYNIAYDARGYVGGELHPLYGKTGEDAVAYGNSYFKGRRHTKYTRELQSRIAKTPKHMEINRRNLQKAIEHNIGRPLSDSHKQNISNAWKNSGRHVGEDNPMYGKVLGEHPRAISVVQLDLYGNFVSEYSCIKETENYGYNKSCVRDCCIGRQKTHRGYRWTYKREYELNTS